jgi:ribonuclease HII
MLELDAQHPQYGFAQHKGYGVSAAACGASAACTSAAAITAHRLCGSWQTGQDGHSLRRCVRLLLLVRCRH